MIGIGVLAKDNNVWWRVVNIVGGMWQTWSLAYSDDTGASRPLLAVQRLRRHALDCIGARRPNTKSDHLGHCRVATANLFAAVIVAVTGAYAFASPPASYHGGYQGFAGPYVYPSHCGPFASSREALECGCRAWRANSYVCSGLWMPDAMNVARPDPNGGFTCFDAVHQHCALWALAAPVCPAGTSVQVVPGASSHDPDNKICVADSSSLEARAHNLGLSPIDCGVGGPSSSGNAVANPVNPSVGNKIQVEEDFRSDGPVPIIFVRTYNSDETAPNTAIGARWHHNFARRIVSLNGQTPSSTEPEIYLRRGDGGATRFQRLGSTSTYTSQADPAARIMRLDANAGGPGWEYRPGQDDEREIYRSDGLLVSLISRAGLAVRLTYDELGRLATVSNDLGSTLTFEYTSEDRIQAITGAPGYRYTYSYDNGRLVRVTNPAAASRVYHYEDARFPRALTGITDERGIRFATYAYDDQQRAVLSEHAGSVERFAFQYNPDGSASISDPLGTVRTYRYVNSGTNKQLSAVEGTPNPSCGNPPSRSFAGEYVVSQTDWNGNLTTFQRNDPSRADLVTSVTRANGTSISHTTSTEWHQSFRLPTRVVEPDRITEYTYDDRGNRRTVRVTNGQGQDARQVEWFYVYSPAVEGLVERMEVRGPGSEQWVYEYYSANFGCQRNGQYHPGCRGQLRSVTSAMGHQTVFDEYDHDGRVTRVRLPTGVTRQFSYDMMGRLVESSIANELTTYEYDAAGKVVRVALPDQSFESYQYDSAHRLVRVTDSSGDRVEYILDAMGNRIREETFTSSGSLSRSIARQHNDANRLVSESLGLLNAATFSYDPNGNLTWQNGPRSSSFPDDVITREYDALNRLTRITSPLNAQTNFVYDLVGNLRQVQDPRGATTSYSYTAHGELSDESSPDRGYSEAYRGADGRVEMRRDGRNKTTSFQYDFAGRLTRESYQDGTFLEFRYDEGQATGRGKLTTAVFPGGQTSFEYSQAGRVWRKIQQHQGGPTFTVQYDHLNGRLATMIYPSGAMVNITRDVNGRIRELRTPMYTIVRGVGYEPFGPVKEWQWGNGQFVGRQTDQAGRLTRYPIPGNSQKTLAYDDGSRIIDIRDTWNPQGAESLIYDAEDRVLSWQQSTTRYQYRYDQNGNRTSVSPSSMGPDYQLQYPPSSNRLQSTSGPAPARTFSYDGAGNVTSDSVLTFQYNDRGRVISTTRGADIVTYVHDAFGQRVAKAGPTLYVPTGTNYFVYDESGQLIGEYDASGAAIQEYVWLDDIPIAIMRGSQYAQQIYYVYADQVNRPVAVTNAMDQIVWRWDTAPFGEMPASEDPSGLGPFVFNLRFPGQYFDRESGLHYNYFRDYDPQTGRYVQSDPIGLRGGLNTYAYAYDNPLRFTDPSGQIPPLVIALGYASAFYGGMSAWSEFYGAAVALSIADSSQQAYSAALAACLNWPQGPACPTLPALEKQMYQCTTSAVGAAGSLPGTLSKPIHPSVGAGSSSQSSSGAGPSDYKYNSPRYPITPSPPGGGNGIGEKFYSPGYNR